MRRFRLRYGSTDLDLPLGDFVIGRSSGCHLSVDDNLVSRRHAILHVTEDGVLLEDLGSRNGVHLNGKKLERTVALQNFDRVGIGHQELVLLSVDGEFPQPKTGMMEKCGNCGHINGLGSQRCGKCGVSLAREFQTLILADEPKTEERPLTAPPDDPSGSFSEGDEATRLAPGFVVLAPVAEKSLALGRYEEAAKMIGGALERLPAAFRERAPADLMFDRALAIGMKLAEGPQSSKWITWVIAIHAASARLMRSDVIDRLHELVRKARYNSAGPIRDYIATLSARDLSPSERFTLRRIESLLRVISA